MTQRRAGTERGGRRTVDDVPLVRIEGGMQGVGAGLLTVAVAVALLVAKPWQSGTAQPPSARPAAAVAVSSPGRSATPRPTIGENAVMCYSRAAWRLVTLERDGTTEQRGWYAVEPVRNAVRPEDRRISHRRIVTGSLDALGFCAPATAGEGAVRFWRLDESGRAHRLDGVEALDDSGGDGVARLFRPPSLVGPYGFASWPTGRYTVAVRETGGERTWWLGVHLARAPTGG